MARTTLRNGNDVQYADMFTKDECAQFIRNAAAALTEPWNKTGDPLRDSLRKEVAECFEELATAFDIADMDRQN